MNCLRPSIAPCVGNTADGSATGVVATDYRDQKVPLVLLLEYMAEIVVDENQIGLLQIESTAESGLALASGLGQRMKLVRVAAFTPSVL